MSSFKLGRFGSNLSKKNSSLSSSISNLSSSGQNTPPAKPIIRKNRPVFNYNDPKTVKLMTPQRVLKKPASETLRSCIKTTIPVKRKRPVAFKVFSIFLLLTS